MKALILAGGTGSRLNPITKKMPKGLVPVNGIPIIANQLESLLDAGIRDITVIAGYKGDMLEKEISMRFPNINIIYNHEYMTTNNMYSAYLGRETVIGSDFIMMNADIYFDPSVVSCLIANRMTNAIVTDIGRYVYESMKVKIKENRVISISKNISEDEAYGTSIDIYRFSNEAGEAFFEKCREYIEDKHKLNEWTEVALNDILPQFIFSVCRLEGRWCEIDNIFDLKEAERIFSTT